MIVWENDGLMPLEAATTFGINAKPGSENPIGYFGTGLKYAIAVCLRLGGRFRLFLGDTEYEFYIKDEDFRGKNFQVIRMRKRKGWAKRWSYDRLPFTTELGKNWEPWMAVRELESNVRDENGSSFIPEGPWDDEKPGDETWLHEHHVREGRTVIVVECPEMEEAYENLDHIFLSPEKKLLAEIGPLQIYEGSSPYIFYRGLRVTDLGDRPSRLTYNFTLGVTLTEDRTSKYPYSDQHRIMEAVMSTTDQDILDTVMDAKEGEHFEAHLPWDQPYVPPSTSYFASLGYRVSKGLGLPKRMKSYYEDATKEDEVDKYLEVRLLRSQIEALIKLLETSYRLDPADKPEDPDSIIEQLKDALPDDEVLF